MTRDSIETLMIRAMIHMQRNEALPFRLIDQLTESARREFGSGHCASTSSYRILGRIQQGQYLEALVEIRSILTRHPNELELLHDVQGALTRVAGALEEQAQLNPLMEGLGEIYEQLHVFGMVPLRLHAALIKRHRLLGESRRAQELERKVRRVAPNLLDLADGRHSRPELPENALVDRSPALEPEFPHQCEVMQEILELQLPEQAKLALEKTCDLLEKSELSEVNRDFIRYRQAIALDYLEKPLDALLILSDLVERWPTHLDYARSFRIVIENVRRHAGKLIRADPRSPAIRGFASVLDQVDFCPYNIKLALSLQECVEGGADNARSRLCALLELSPHDTDYLEAALTLASELQDKAWRREILGGARDHLERFPYLVWHRILLSRHPEQTS